MDESELKRERLRLTNLRKYLLRIVRAVNKELIQTDVEWMNLVAVAKALNEPEQPSTSASTSQELKHEPSLPHLDLDPHRKTTVVNSDEEFDSD